MHTLCKSDRAGRESRGFRQSPHKCGGREGRGPAAGSRRRGAQAGGRRLRLEELDGLALDEARREVRDAGVVARLADLVHEAVGGDLAHLAVGNARRGQWRVADARVRQVVEADHAHVLGDPDALLGHRPHAAEGHDVILHKEGSRERRVRGEPLLHRVVGGVDGGAHHDAPLGVDGQPGLAHGAAVPALAQGEVLDAVVARDVADLAVAVLGQVGDGAEGGVLVLRDHGLEEEPVGPAVHDDERRLRVAEEHVVLLGHLGAQEHDAVAHVVRDLEGLLGRGLAVAELDRGERGLQLELGRHALDALDDAGVERALVLLIYNAKITIM